MSPPPACRRLPVVFGALGLLLLLGVGCGPGIVSTELGDDDREPPVDVGLDGGDFFPPGDDDGGVTPTDGGVTPTDGGSVKPPVKVTSASIRIATYNILGSSHVSDGTSVGQCASPPGCVAVRAQRSTQTIQGNLDADATLETSPFDIVGVQEMNADQYTLFHKLLTAPGYAHFPATTSSQWTIYWKTSRFTLVGSGTMPYPWYGDDNLIAGHKANWVRLKEQVTGGQVIVLDHHPVSWNKDPGSDADGALKREKSAQLARAWVQSMMAKYPGVPVFVIGDFNSSFVLRDKDGAYKGDRSRLPYCILTAGSLMAHVADLEDGKTGACPTHTSTSHSFRIDHIFVAQRAGVQLIRANAFLKTSAAPNITMSSDHAPAYADFKLVVTH